MHQFAYNCLMIAASSTQAFMYTNAEISYRVKGHKISIIDDTETWLDASKLF